MRGFAVQYVIASFPINLGVSVPAHTIIVEAMESVIF